MDGLFFSIASKGEMYSVKICIQKGLVQLFKSLVALIVASSRIFAHFLSNIRHLLYIFGRFPPIFNFSFDSDVLNLNFSEICAAQTIYTTGS